MSATLTSVDGQDEASILHNAQVVQIERKEKFRLQASNPKNA